MKTFLNYLGKHSKILSLALFFAAVNQIFSLLNPQVFRLVIDNYAAEFEAYTQSEFITGVGLLLLLYIGVALISRLGKAFQDYYVNVVSERVGTGMYNDSVAHVFTLPFKVFENEQSGSLLQKLQKARDHSKKLINDVVNIGFFSLIGILFVIIYAFTVHYWIGLVFTLSLPLVGSIIYFTGKSIKKAQQIIVLKSAELAASTTETLQNVGLVKSLGLEHQEIKRLNDVHEIILELELQKVVILRKLSFIQGTLVNAVSTLIVFVSMILIFQGSISLGEFLALWFYGFFVFGPLGQFAGLVQSYQEAQASVGELEVILQEQTITHDREKEDITHIDSISFDSVSFSYIESTPSLSSINLTIKAGDTIALAGPSGSGKSTFLKLLLGLYKPQKGIITYNGIPQKNINPMSLRKRVGYVPQESQVFAGTIRENLLFVEPSASDDDCLKALSQAKAHGILKRSDDGLDTLLGENGIKLSGGERQRIAIARALLRKPDILIFDEATSSLDSLTEYEINQTIKEIKKEHPELIMILVAHRLSTIEHADTIYVMRNGIIDEYGTHTELLNNKGLYYSLWNGQQ
ncbi:MAG: ABC transporter ATP-binding protein/permease [Candidatus Pacebacteria bacterium]|nr:ABC transporter ATP-binding protein/permease [Candidatus Paceibacterota bacterium]